MKLMHQVRTTVSTFSFNEWIVEVIEVMKIGEKIHWSASKRVAANDRIFDIKMLSHIDVFDESTHSKIESSILKASEILSYAIDNSCTIPFMYKDDEDPNNRIYFDVKNLSQFDRIEHFKAILENI